MTSGEGTPLLVNHRGEGDAGFDSLNNSRYAPSTSAEVRGMMTHSRFYNFIYLNNGVIYLT